MADPREFIDGSSSLVLGCDSYTQSAELDAREYVMGQNVVCRGGIVQTRPGSRTVFCLPDGNFQGCTMFTPANGIAQLVFAVDGAIYVSPSPFTEYRRLWNLQFSNTAKFIAWAVCLKSTDYDSQGVLISLPNPYSVLMIQDGLTRAAYWDGNTAAHLNPATPDFPDQTDIIPGFTETPVGLWMIWSGNRLWVSRGNQIFASDIGNPLKFTEAQYLNEARAFYLSGDCTGMIEVPSDNNVSKGFIAFTDHDGTLFQSYIQDRTTWLDTPLFQNTIIPTIGCVAPRSLVTQYGLNWWFSARGLTNINAALRQNITSRLDYQDNQMFTSKAYLSPELDGICGSFFENYLFMSVPSQDSLNRHTWVLDQAPFDGNVSAWTGFWSGWRPIEWARGIVNGAERIFFGSVDYDGKNRVWEAMLPDRTDNGVRITCFAQLRDHAAGNLDRKRYEWSKFFLSQIYGDVNLNVYVASTKGGYQLQKQYKIVATQGQVFSDVKYSEAGPLMIGNIVQSRTIRTPENPEDNDCNRCGVESQEGNMIDYAFSHLLVWEGQMGIRAYQMHMRQEPDKNTGDCEEDEVGPRSLNAAGCSGLELLVDTQVFRVFTARADGSATLAAGGAVYIQQVGYSIFGPQAAQQNAQERVRAVQNRLQGAVLAPGVYNNGPEIPFPDGGAGITPETDGAGVLGPGGGPGGDPGGEIVVDEPIDPSVEDPDIIQQPQSLSIDDGQDAEFFIAADGTEPLVFAWHVSADGGMTWNDVTNGGVYSGADTPALAITGATTALSGYQYRCRVTNQYGADTSDAATLTVTSAACFLTMPTTLIDGTTTPYTDLPTAQAAMNDQAYDCLLEALAGSTNRTSLSANVAGSTMTINEALNDSPFVGGDSFIARVYLTAANGLGYSYNVTVNQFCADYQIDLYADDQTTVVDSFHDQDAFGPTVSGSGNLTVPSDGYYYVRVNVSGCPSFPTASDSLTFTGTLNVGAGGAFCQPRAAYGGTPDYVNCTP